MEPKKMITLGNLGTHITAVARKTRVL